MINIIENVIRVSISKLIYKRSRLHNKVVSGKASQKDTLELRNIIVRINKLNGKLNSYRESSKSENN
jgi:hypothetical protein